MELESVWPLMVKPNKLISPPVVTQLWPLEPPQEPRRSPRSLCASCANNCAYLISGLGWSWTDLNSELILALLTLHVQGGVPKYVRIFLTPTQSRDQVRASLCAVRASRMNDLAVTVSIPRMQQAVYSSNNRGGGEGGGSLRTQNGKPAHGRTLRPRPWYRGTGTGSAVGLDHRLLHGLALLGSRACIRV